MLSGVLAAADLVIIPVVPERAAITPTFRTAQLAEAPASRTGGTQPGGPAPRRRAGRIACGRPSTAAACPRMRSVIRRYVAHNQSQLNGEMITQYRGDGLAESLDDMRRFHAELLLMLGRIDPERRP